MATPEFQGFEDDPASAAPPAPTAPPAAPPPLASYAFEEEDPAAEPARKRNPLAGSATAPTALPTQAAAPAVRPPPPPAPDPVDQDIKPGSAKDLWTCPHCGSGNKPQRTTCRSCGKSPTDAVAKPWFLRLPVLLGVPALLVLGGVAWKVTRPDLTAHPADAAHVDTSVRRGGGRQPDVTLGDRTFTPRQRLSVVGRVVAARSHPSVSGVTTVILALGADAKDERFGQMSCTFNGDRAEVSGGRFVALHLLSTPTVPAAGTYLSVCGRSGQLAEGMTLVSALEGDDVVLPDAP